MKPVELAAALERAARALDAGDPAAAAAAMDGAVLACDAALRAGPRLDRADVGLLRRTHQQCESAAGRLRARLVEELGAAGSARRALDAYQR